MGRCFILDTRGMNGTGLMGAQYSLPWSAVEVEGTRGPITFSRTPGISVWQWTWPPIQVVDRDPAQIDRFRVLQSLDDERWLRRSTRGLGPAARRGAPAGS